MRYLRSSSIALLLTTLLIWVGTASPSLARTEAPGASIQPYIDRVLDQITEFSLENGMRFIVMERHQVPIVSFMTYVDVGAAYEEDGKTGAAHFLEHLAFKGTPRIGTTNFEAEKPVLDRLDVLYDQLKAAQATGRDAEVAQLQQEFDQLRTEAATYVVQNQMGQIVEQSGGVGLNATTSADATRYFYSFPANKLELWMSLESERFLEPVFREFFEERDVILEERRMRTDNSPIGKMIEVFLETALPNHPYGRPIIGYEQDLRNLTRPDIQNFFDRYYTPSNMIAAVVGDVDPDEVKRLAEVYFGRYQARTEIPDLEVAFPEQTEAREVELQLPSEPWYLEGYPIPAVNQPDRIIGDMIAALLTSGRTSRLYQALVEQQQIALGINVATGFPGDRFPGLMMLYATTAPGHTVDEIATVINTEIERLKTELVSPAELDRIKTQTRASLLRTLSSNEGMAALLPEYEANTGDWRNLFNQLQRIEAITPADVQRVAQEIFQSDKVTIGRLLPQAE